MNYINKEPFNEDIDASDPTGLLIDNKWRQSIIENFKQVINDIKILQSNPIENKAAIKDKYKQGLILCTTIKKLNRISHIKVNKARIKTHEEKNKIDEYHLELQNLLYEISYLKKEINKCLEFRSLHENIELVPLEEFYAKAPSEISNISVTKQDEHKLKLAQLDWELIERQQMTGRIKELEKQIDLHEKQLKSKQNKLESLHPKLNQIIEACKPTLEYFNTNFQEDTMFSEIVQYLPKPLYQFYVMISAYKDAIDKDISKIEVCGDLEEAKKFDLNDNINLDEDDSGEEDEDDEAYKKKKSKSKSNKKKVSVTDKVFSSYPLSCKVTFNCYEYGQFVLEFFYLNILKIICVKSELKLQNNTFSNENSILKAENVFNCLYEDDAGLESPNIANKILLSNMGIKSIEPHLKQIGSPYKWCQYLCGLYYDNKFDRHSLISSSQSVSKKDDQNKSSDDMKDDVEMAADNNNETNSSDQTNEKNDSKLFEQIMNKLKFRFRSRIILQETLNSLKNNQIPRTNSYSVDKLKFKVQSTITNFKEINYDKLASLNYAKNLIHSSMNIDENECAFYEITIKNQNATLQSQIIINQDYPKVYPLFLININWKHDRNNTNDEAVRDMERELNIYRDYEYTHDGNLGRKLSLMDKTGNFDLFAKQIYHLLVCFDIYLESESYFLNDSEYQRTKLFTITVKGRDRKRPYSYMTNMDLFIQRMNFNSAE